jgi:hypothetical protein
MEAPQTHKNYPLYIVILSNLVSLGIYGLGFYIMAKLSLVVAFIYLALILALEIRLLKGCTNCYYWGRICGFGRGRLSRMFFKKGKPTKFCSKKFTWKSMIGDLLVPLIPFITGTFLIITEFNVYLLIAIVLMLFLTTYGNGFIRSQLTCRYCRQKELGCPASDFFSKVKQ